MFVFFSAFPLCAGEHDAGPALESPTVNATGVGRCRRPTDPSSPNPPATGWILPPSFPLVGYCVTFPAPPPAPSCAVSFFHFPQGTPDNHVPVPLRSWIRDQSTTPITVRGGVEVEVKVRVDPICNADAGNPSEITALAASIFLTTDTGDTRSYVTDRSWGWRDGSTGLKPSPLWPDNPGGAPPGAQWLTHIRRSPTREVFWTSLVKNLPANVCEGVSAVAPPAAGGGGG